jgi:hypothetical protein
MLLNRTRRSETLSGKESAELKSESPNRWKSCCKNKTPRSKAPEQDTAEFKDGVVRTEAFAENVLLVLLISRRAASYGPNDELLRVAVFSQKCLRKRTDEK